MKKTLIFYKPEYTDLAIKLRDNYRAHDHGDADIVSEEEHDDIEYADKMHYDEAVFIEDSDTVTVHDIESGYTNRVPASDVFYNDPKPGSHEGITSRDALNILADAISDVGSWWCCMWVTICFSWSSVMCSCMMNQKLKKKLILLMFWLFASMVMYFRSFWTI